MIPKLSHYSKLFIPKLFICLREGYSLSILRKDIPAGLTVAIISFPLAMALAIASGVSPERGLYTAIIAGFLISFFGGSRHQIGGPTGAFVVIIYGIIQQHGYDGLAIATLMAGAMLIIMGFAQFGAMIKYMPYPLITGFTAGIAVVIFSLQVKDFLGLSTGALPNDFIDKWRVYFTSMHTIHWPTHAIGFLTLGIILGIRKHYPRWPSFLIAIVISATLVYFLDLNVATIGARFGELPNHFPTFSLPNLPSWDTTVILMPAAFTIALLAGMESLLSAVVADGMTGRKHKSNVELVAQGIANIASILGGGIPATGAIARTATNIKSGGQTPLSGLFHAVFVASFLMILSPFAKWIPLTSLAAILMIIAWNMSESRHFLYLMHAPKSDRAILLTTFLLTIFADLVIAIQVGVVLAAFLFMKRMSDVTELKYGLPLLQEDQDDFDAVIETVPHNVIPEGVEVFQINGPFFFGATTILNDILNQIQRQTRTFILRMHNVPFIDASGARALEEFFLRCSKVGISTILVGVQKQPLATLNQLNLLGEVKIAKSLTHALTLSNQEK
ncbi:MAG: sulfate permease [Alphaproteobacteria bacterium]|nr:sulfate permease [Alphaproteobacteria bacterium]